MPDYKRSLFAISSISLIIILGIYGCASTKDRKYTGSKMRIAVLNFNVKTNNTYGVKDIGEKLTDMFSTAFFKSGRFVLIERDKVEKVFREQEFQLSGMVNPATAVEIGRILGAQAVVMGSISNIHCGYMIFLGIIGICQSTINTMVISTETGRENVAISKTGKSYAWGIPMKVTAGGKTRDDILGIKRTSEDMINDSLRNAVEKTVKDISKKI